MHDKSHKNTSTKSFQTENIFASIQRHKNGFMRFAIVVIGLPISALCYAFPLYKFMLPRTIFTVLLIIMIIETHKLLPLSMRPSRIAVSIAAGLIFPLCAWTVVLSPSFEQSAYMMPPALFVLIIIIFSIYVISHEAPNIIEKISGFLFLAVYPGLFGFYYMLLPSLTNNVLGFVTVTGIVYSNDGLAYLAGKFWGRKKSKAAHNKKESEQRSEKIIVKISPKKTVAGFIGGFISGLIYFAAVYTIQRVQGRNFFPGHPLVAAAFACIINISGMLGDLFESALKRAAHSKNSGSVMLGRGGTLDTFDSLLPASAAYFILYPLFFPGT